MEGPDPDDGLMNDWYQALDSLNRVVQQLRPVNLEAANTMSRLVNEISNSFFTFLVESESFMNSSAAAMPSSGHGSTDPAVSEPTTPRRGPRSACVSPDGLDPGLSYPPLVPPGFSPVSTRAVKSGVQQWPPGRSTSGPSVAGVALQGPQRRSASGPSAAAPSRRESSTSTMHMTKSQNIVLDLTTPASGSAQDFPGISWARIAALEDKDKNKGFVSLTKQTPAAHPLQDKTNKNSTRSPTEATLQPGVLEPKSYQSRVIWIFNCLPKTCLTDISQGIQEGPLMSIVFAQDRTTAMRACCVIFHQAEHALAFLARHRRERAEHKLAGDNGDKNKAYTFFPGEHVELGSAYPADTEIRMMDFPTCARRRLTVVRKGLFCDGQLAPGAFERDVHAMAGRENVELIHLYNTGNATVVLASVKCAMMVKTAMEARARRNGGPYAGATCTFSKDPCEVSIRLISAMEGPSKAGKR